MTPNLIEGTGHLGLSEVATSQVIRNTLLISAAGRFYSKADAAATCCFRAVVYLVEVFR
jgi:hypothetical protein